MNTTMKVVTGFLVGASAGIIAGLLIAPKSGKKTRQMLADQTQHLRERLVGTVEHAKKAYSEKAESSVSNGKS